MTPYALVLVLAGLAFVVLERVAPRQPLGFWRRGAGLDFLYLIFNGEVAGAVFAAWLGSWWPAASLVARRQSLGLEWLAGQSVVVQLLVLWLVKDFVQW